MCRYSLRGNAASRLFATGTRFSIRTGLSVFVAFLRVTTLGDSNAKLAEGTRKCKDPDSFLKTITDFLWSPSATRHANNGSPKTRAERGYSVRVVNHPVDNYVDFRTLVVVVENTFADAIVAGVCGIGVQRSVFG